MFVFQQYGKSIFPWKTVLENVVLGIKYRVRATKESLEELALDHLALVDLDRYPHYYPYQTLRWHAAAVAIARALVRRPKSSLWMSPSAPSMP